MPGIGLGLNLVKHSGGFNDEYKAVYDAMTNKPPDNIAAAQNTLFGKMVNGGIWNLSDAAYLLSQYSNSDSEALINIINPGSNTGTLEGAVNPSFVSLEGFTGGNGYINTHFNETIHGSNYTLNEAAFAFYSRTDKIETTSELGAERGSGGRSYLVTRYSTDDQIVNVNSTGLSGGNTSTDSRGMYVIIRTGGSIYVYRNKVLQFSGALLVGILPNYEWSICGVNDDGVTDLLSTRQVSFAWIGGALTVPQMEDFTDAVEEYMDFNGKGVAA
jgi:hypothetical protein